MTFSNTVRTLRHDAARRVRDLWTGTLTTLAPVAALNLADTSRVEYAGYFSNYYIHIGSDAAAEDHRIQTNEPQQLTLADDGGIVIEQPQGTVYELHRLWSVPEYNGFIADAVRSLTD